MTEDELLQRYGLHPTGPDLDQVREILRGEVARERHRLGDGDTELMKLCCVQLFHHGSLADVLLIWQAKESGWDPHHSIDVQLLCGAGLDATKAFLADDSGGEARKTLKVPIGSTGRRVRLRRPTAVSSRDVRSPARQQRADARPVPPATVITLSLPSFQRWSSDDRQLQARGCDRRFGLGTCRPSCWHGDMTRHSRTAVTRCSSGPQRG